MQKQNWILNDGGRSESGRKGTAGDCVCRAVSIATGIPYDEVYSQLSTINTMTKGDKTCSARNGIHTKSVYFKKFMEGLGWKWTATMRIGQGCKVHLRADELPLGRIICAVSKHYVAVIDGVIHDTFDPSRGGNRCVYGYWSKESINIS